MKANILLDDLPREVKVDGMWYPVNYGYRAHILIEMVMFSDRDDEQKLLDALNIFYRKNIPGNMEAAMEQLLLFHRCGAELKKRPDGKPVRTAGKNVRAYCFEQDAEMIYAAFRTQYRINLNQTADKDLHWWEFMAMFDSLSEELLISRVMYYRTADLKGLGKNQKAFLKKMRSIYALKKAESSMDHEAKLAKRNRDMKEYVRKRMDECRKE